MIGKLKSLNMVAKISYPMFLFHVLAIKLILKIPLINELGNLSIRTVVVYVLSGGLTICIATILHYIIEIPCDKLIKNLNIVV